MMYLIFDIAEAGREREREREKGNRRADVQTCRRANGNRRESEKS